MMTSTNESPVSYEEAVRRVSRHAGARSMLASSIAQCIWPRHRMKAQGSALAAGPFIRRMINDGVIASCVDGYRVIGVKS